MEQNHLKFDQEDDLVSIILPTLNSESYLKNCLKSISNQSYKKLELIIIDGFSKDNTLRIVNSYSKKLNIKLIQIKTKNLASALNFGIIHSKGEYIARMDSDDIMTKNRIFNQVNHFKKHKFNGILGTQAFRFNRFFIKPFLLFKSNNFLKLNLFFGSPFVHPSVMLSRKIFERGNFYNDEYNECEDYEFWSRLSKNFSFKNLNTFGLYYRVHANSASNLKSPTLEIYKTKIVINHLKSIDLNLTNDDFLTFLKIISLNLNKNDDFQYLNQIILKVFNKMKDNSKLVTLYGNDIKKFIKIKYFRFCLKSLKCNNFNLNDIHSSNINIWSKYILRIFFFFNISI